MGVLLAWVFILVFVVGMVAGAIVMSHIAQDVALKMGHPDVAERIWKGE